jgi:hypothetical protein
VSALVIATTQAKSILKLLRLPRIPAQCQTHPVLLLPWDLRPSPPLRESLKPLLLTPPDLSARPRPRVSSVPLRVCSRFLYLTLSVSCKYLLCQSQLLQLLASVLEDVKEHLTVLPATSRQQPHHSPTCRQDITCICLSSRNSITAHIQQRLQIRHLSPK